MHQSGHLNNQPGKELNNFYNNIKDMLDEEMPNLIGLLCALELISPQEIKLYIQNYSGPNLKTDFISFIESKLEKCKPMVTQNELNKRYKEKAKQFHPDKYPDPNDKKIADICFKLLSDYKALEEKWPMEPLKLESFGDSIFDEIDTFITNMEFRKFNNFNKISSDNLDMWYDNQQDTMILRINTKSPIQHKQLAEALFSCLNQTMNDERRFGNKRLYRIQLIIRSFRRLANKLPQTKATSIINGELLNFINQAEEIIQINDSDKKAEEASRLICGSQGNLNYEESFLQKLSLYLTYNSKHKEGYLRHLMALHFIAYEAKYLSKDYPNSDRQVMPILERASFYQEQIEIFLPLRMLSQVLSDPDAFFNKLGSQGFHELIESMNQVSNQSSSQVLTDELMTQIIDTFYEGAIAGFIAAREAAKKTKVPYYRGDLVNESVLFNEYISSKSPKILDSLDFNSQVSVKYQVKLFLLNEYALNQTSVKQELEKNLKDLSNYIEVINSFYQEFLTSVGENQYIDDFTKGKTRLVLQLKNCLNEASRTDLYPSYPDNNAPSYGFSEKFDSSRNAEQNTYYQTPQRNQSAQTSNPDSKSIPISIIEAIKDAEKALTQIFKLEKEAYYKKYKDFQSLNTDEFSTFYSHLSIFYKNLSLFLEQAENTLLTIQKRDELYQPIYEAMYDIIKNHNNYPKDFKLSCLENHFRNVLKIFPIKDAFEDFEKEYHQKKHKELIESFNSYQQTQSKPQQQSSSTTSQVLQGTSQAEEKKRIDSALIQSLKNTRDAIKAAYQTKIDCQNRMQGYKITDQYFEIYYINIQNLLVNINAIIDQSNTPLTLADRIDLYKKICNSYYQVCIDESNYPSKSKLQELSGHFTNTLKIKQIQEQFKTHIKEFSFEDELKLLSESKKEIPNNDLNANINPPTSASPSTSPGSSQSRFFTQESKNQEQKSKINITDTLSETLANWQILLNQSNFINYINKQCYPESTLEIQALYINSVLIELSEGLNNLVTQLKDCRYESRKKIYTEILGLLNQTFSDLDLFYSANDSETQATVKRRVSKFFYDNLEFKNIIQAFYQHENDYFKEIKVLYPICLNCGLDSNNAHSYFQR